MSAHEPYRIDPIPETPLFDVVYFDRSTGRQLGLAAFRMTIAGATTVMQAWSADPLLADQYTVAMVPCSTFNPSEPAQPKPDLRTAADVPADLSHRAALTDEFEIFIAAHQIGNNSGTPAWIIGDFLRRSTNALIQAIEASRHHVLPEHPGGS